MQVAVLGPLGTYTHEAAFKIFDNTATYDECDSVADVINVLSPEIIFGVIPQENTIFGSVVETYDTLKSVNGCFVRGETTLKIEHCLLVKKGVRHSQIKRIMSHEQALGQCRDFIAEKLPNAQKVKTSSTAAAAKALLDSPEDCAAICSSVCATLYEELEVLSKGIQNEKSNFTRFFVVAYSERTDLPPILGKECQMRALTRLSIPPIPSYPSGVTHGVVEYLQLMGLFATRIDRRPSAGPFPFHNTYFVELQASEPDSDPPHVLASWTHTVKSAISKVEDSGGQIALLGVW